MHDAHSRSEAMAQHYYTYRVPVAGEQIALLPFRGHRKSTVLPRRFAVERSPMDCNYRTVELPTGSEHLSQRY